MKKHALSVLRGKERDFCSEWHRLGETWTGSGFFKDKNRQEAQAMYAMGAPLPVEATGDAFLTFRADLWAPPPEPSGTKWTAVWLRAWVKCLCETKVDFNSSYEWAPATEAGRMTIPGKCFFKSTIILQQALVSQPTEGTDHL